MTMTEIETRIAVIKNLQRDPEAAHTAEDDLRADFILSVAEKKNSLGRKARLVLTTTDIDFARWYA